MANHGAVVDRLRTFDDLLLGPMRSGALGSAVTHRAWKMEVTWKNIDKLFAQAKLIVASPAKMYATVEPYMGSPNKETPKYERVRYRYAVESAEQARAFVPAMNVRVHAQGYPRRRAAFGRDTEFATLDLFDEILKSDVNVVWKDHLARCRATGQWVLTKDPLTAEMREKVVSYEWVCGKIADFEKEAERASLMEKAEKERGFIEQHSSRFKIDFETILQYIVDNGETAKKYIANIQPCDIPRFTKELLPKDVMWPKWYEDAPAAFRTMALELKATPGVLLAGSFEQNAFKAFRTAFNEKLATDAKPLPNSQKIRGLLEYFEASAEVIDAFEKRTGAKGFATTHKAADIAVKQNRFFISNEMLPLFMIGNWGKEKDGTRTYASCQTWNKNGWQAGGGNYCRTPASWEDPYILVAWAGEETIMRTRILVHLMVDPKTKEKVAGLNNWYGTHANQAPLVALLTEWAKENGYKLVKLYAGHYSNAQAGGQTGGQCEWPADVTFNNGAWYSDLGGFSNGGGHGGPTGSKLKTQFKLSYNENILNGARLY